MAADAEKPGGKAKRAFLTRLSPEVLAAVEQLAAAELRSANAQIEVLLRAELSRRGLLKPRGGEATGTGSDH